MHCEIDGEGQIRRPELHDATAFALEGLDARTLLIRCRTEGGSTFSLKLHDVHALRVENFQCGNIILYGRIVPVSRVTDSDIQAVIGEFGGQREIERLLTKVQARELCLFLTASSYGMVLSAVCKEVTFEECLE